MSFGGHTNVEKLPSLKALVWPGLLLDLQLMKQRSDVHQRLIELLHECLLSMLQVSLLTWLHH